ncbi:hypothetical protein ACIP88_07295 [Streptomyces uncialis]|uniref:hypothetical protein n=1 Tax=Streptomyces uncialis TaxID=1048205 RepID=UPI0038091B1C
MRRPTQGPGNGCGGDGDGTADRPRRRRARSAAVSAVALLAALTGCGDEGPDIPRTATGTLEELAAEAGCVPETRAATDELRQADCRTGDGRFVLATFTTDRGLREWLNGAKDYGGTYLVGRRWVAVAEPDVVGALRAALGGDVERSTHATDSQDPHGTDPDGTDPQDPDPDGAGAPGHGGH